MWAALILKIAFIVFHPDTSLTDWLKTPSNYYGNLKEFVRLKAQENLLLMINKSYKSCSDGNCSVEFYF